MKIQIIGSGCPKCRALEQNAREAARIAGIDAQFEKVSGADEIVEIGVMMTPALAIDGVVKKSGRVLKPEEIVPLLQFEA